MNFENQDIDIHEPEPKVFTAPKSGLYTITNTLSYVNNLKFGIWVNRAKMRGIKLSNKNFKKLRLQCMESYYSNSDVQVSLGHEIVAKMDIPNHILKKMGHQINKNNGVIITRRK